MIADPERTLYQMLGARRPKPLWVLRPRVATAGLRALRAGERVSVTPGDDTLQLGADVVLDRDGRIVFLHLAADAADRTPPEELIAVLRRLDDAPTASMARETPAVGRTMPEGRACDGRARHEQAQRPGRRRGRHD